MSQQEQSYSSTRGGLQLPKVSTCDVSKILVCAAIACISALVIVSTLTHLGVFKFGKNIYHGAAKSVQGVYNKTRQMVQSPRKRKQEQEQSQEQIDQTEEYYDSGYPEANETYDNEIENADALDPLTQEQQKLANDVKSLAARVDELEKKQKTKTETFEADEYNIDYEDQENFGNLSTSETKAFGDGIVCHQGTPDEQNIINPIGAQGIEGGSRCKNQNGVYDAIIGDAHPYYLNQIAAGGKGNELIAMTEKRRR